MGAMWQQLWRQGLQQGQAWGQFSSNNSGMSGDEVAATAARTKRRDESKGNASTIMGHCGVQYLALLLQHTSDFRGAIPLIYLY
jgi:hypothetical protein